MGLIDYIEGKKPKQVVESQEEVDFMNESLDEVITEEWGAEEEGNLKLQKKAIRTKLQHDDDPNEPFGYRKGKADTILAHALRLKFNKEDDARKNKSPEHIAKMQAARKQKIKEYIENL